jgi:hypothetical protein
MRNKNISFNKINIKLRRTVVYNKVCHVKDSIHLNLQYKNIISTSDLYGKVHLNMSMLHWTPTDIIIIYEIFAEACNISEPSHRYSFN